MGEDLPQPGAIGEIGLDQRTPFHGRAAPVLEVVNHDGGVTRAGDFLSRVAANVAGASADEDSHAD
jgi:hypothetical protein